MLIVSVVSSVILLSRKYVSLIGIGRPFTINFVVPADVSTTVTNKSTSLVPSMLEKLPPKTTVDVDEGTVYAAAVEDGASPCAFLNVLVAIVYPYPKAIAIATPSDGSTHSGAVAPLFMAITWFAVPFASFASVVVPVAYKKSPAV